MYTFKMYYRVNGLKRRRSREVILDYDTLLEAWMVALDIAIAYTEEGEILDSIQEVPSEYY